MMEIQQRARANDRLAEITDVAEGEAIAGSLLLGVVAIKHPYIAVLGFAATQALQYAADKKAEALDAASTRLLEQALLELQSSDAAAFASLQSASPQERHRIIFGENGAGGLLGGTTVGAIASVNTRARLVTLPAQILNERIAAVSAGSVQVAEEVAGLTQAVGQLNDRHIAFEAETKKQISDLQVEQARLDRTVGGLTATVGSNTRRIDTLERLYFERLSPTQKLKIIEKGGLPGVQLSTEEVESLTRAAYVEETQTYAQIVNRAAGDIAQISTAFGLGLGEEMGVAQTVAGAVLSGASLFSGEPMTMLSGAAGLAGLFGGGRGGGGDAATAQQINALRNEMRAYHRETMRALGALSAQVDQGFQTVIERQDNTFDQLVFVTRAEEEQLTANLRQCETAAAIWIREADETHDERAERFEQVSGVTLPSCRIGVENIFRFTSSGGAKISAAFLAHAARPGVTMPAPEDQPTADEITAFARWKADVFSPTYSYTMRRVGRELTATPRCANDQVIFTALTSSSSWAGEHRALLRDVAARCAAGEDVLFQAYPIGPNPGPINVPYVLGNPLDADSIAWFSERALAATRMYEFTAPGTDVRVLRRAQLLSSGNLSTGLAERHTRNIADVLSMGIAQSSMMGGDLVLELLAGDIEAALADPAKANLTAIPAARWASCDADPGVPAGDYFNALCILRHNPVLRYNFVRHWVRTRIKSSESGDFRRYAAGLAYDRPSLVLSAFRSPMPVAECGPAQPAGSERWCLSLPAAGLAGAGGLPDQWLLPMPGWVETASERLAFLSPRRAELIALRKAARDQLTSYDLSRRLTADAREVYYAGSVLLGVEAAGPDQADAGQP